MATKRNSLVCVCFMILSWCTSASAQDWVSPGALSKDHADLDREGACERCHKKGGGVSDSRCLSCHSRVGLALAKGKGFHTRLVKKNGGGCGSCHRDHQGRSYPLIRWSPPANFAHKAETGFDLVGAHSKTACGACHTHRPGYMGAKTYCSACHKDPHKKELGSTCTKCHTQERFRPASLFSHDDSKFPLTGKHKQLSCSNCHPTKKAAVPKFKGSKFGRCSNCHLDPHRGRTALSPCKTCHSTAGWKKTQGIPPAHQPNAYPLVGKHASVSCRECHGSSLRAKVSRECVSCHKDAHSGRFGKRCQQCHNESGWRNSVIGRAFNHAATGYPLLGRHRKVRCRKCHKSNGSKGLRFTRVARDRCDRCHSSYHPETFVTVEPSTRCEGCHTVSGFEVSTFSVDQHAKSRWPLLGSHVAVPCADCHPQDSDERVQLAVGKKRCSDCHQDPHNGQFDAKMTKDSCDTCHQSSAWSLANFDHQSTGYLLEGAHKDSACASCHKGQPAQYKGVPTRCAGCHRDPHFSQFTTEPVRDCPSCHKQDAWKIAGFDHKLMANWLLDGAHAPLKCADCHPQVKFSAKIQSVKYRLGTHECSTCHQNPHGATP